MAPTMIADIFHLRWLFFFWFYSYFIKEGRVSESGTHNQLLTKRGDYYEYVQLQALSKRD